MSLTFKAFLYERSWRGNPVEIRRFNIAQDVSTSYAYLLEKVSQIFPSLTADDIIVGWTDKDGDLIVISSDEELVEALDQFDGSLFKLYLLKKSTLEPTTENTGSQEPPTCPRSDAGSSQGQQQQRRRHFGVVCDGCSGPIFGIRYKCLVCDDYDLCSACEGKGVHVDHNMISITDPGSYSPWGFHGWGGAHGGPWRGWRCGQQQGGCHGGRRWGGRGGWGGHPHPGYGGSFPPFPLFAAMAGAGCGGGPQAKAGGSEASAGDGKEQTAQGSEPMDTEQTTTEQQRSFLRNIGSAVSNFLQPYGVKVDVDVVGGEKEGKEESASGHGDQGATGATASPEVSKEILDQALAQLKSMGYEDDGGWLTELVKAKGGDIGKVLDALHFTETD